MSSKGMAVLRAIARDAVKTDRVSIRPLRKVGRVQLLVQCSRPTAIIGSFASGHQVTLSVGPKKGKGSLDVWYAGVVDVKPRKAVDLTRFNTEMTSAIAQRGSGAT